MDLITTRGVFGDFGRLKKGHVLKGVKKFDADKMLKSGAYAEATPEAIKAAQAPKKVVGAKAKATAKKAGASSVDGKAIQVAVDAAMTKVRDELAGILKEAGDAIASLKQEVGALRQQVDDTEKRHADEFASIKTHAAEVSEKLAAATKKD